MFEGDRPLVAATPGGSAPEPERMSINDFVHQGLEPGQHALLWDFESRRYVSVVKPTRPGPRLISALLGGLMRASVHAVFVTPLIGGLFD